MKILHVGWWTRSFRSGGLIIYTESLMQEQIKQGHEVYYFCGGRYNLFTKETYTKRYKKDGINIIELVNSPNLIWDFRSIRHHISNPDVEHHFDLVLKELKPDVVHIQELESLSADIISVCKDNSIQVVMSLHNYWPVCPQRDLIDYNGEVCMDYKEGYKCMDCNVLPGSNKLAWMARGYLGITPLPRRLSLVVNKIYNGIPSLMSGNNNQQPDDFHFTDRRSEFARRLNSINLIAVSQRVKDIYSMYGVNSRNISTIHISSRAINFIRRRKRNFENYPVKFGYIGSIQSMKGLHVLLQALEKLDLEKYILNIYGDYNSDYGYRLKNEYDLPNIEFHGGYEYENLNYVLDNVDVGVVPPIWEDNAPQVVFEMLQAGIPVIGSDIGGIPDFIRNNVNGYLFKPGDFSELSSKMNEFIVDPEKIAKFSDNTVSHKTLSEHSREIIDYYRSMLLKKLLKK